MNVQFPNMFPVDLKKGPAIKRGVKLFYGDAYANRIGGYLLDSGASITPGGTCEADAILSNNVTVHLDGTVTGNAAYVDLSADCYSAIGPIEVSVKWKSSEDDTGTTIVKLYGEVDRTVTDSAYDPGTIIPSVSALMEQIADAEQDVAALVDDAEAAKTAAQEAAATASAAYGTDLIAEDYSTETGATAGNYYIHSGDLYLCTANTTGAWDSTKFAQVDVGGQLSDLKSAIDLVTEDVDSLYKAATYGNENYWDLGGSGNQLQANTEYILRIMPNANFTLDSLQIGSSASAGGMVDTIATNISFTSGVQYEVAYTPSESNLRWIRMVSSAAKATSVAFYQVYQRTIAVLIESQTLSTAEKTQARTNIGAAAETEVDEINERIGNVFDTFESVTTAEYTKSGYYINASGQVGTSANFETKKYELPDDCMSVTVKTVLYGEAKIVLTDVDAISADFASTSFAGGNFYPVGNPASHETYETTFDTNGKGFLYIPHYVGDSTVGIVITAKIAGDISKINASLDQKITAAGSYLKPIVDPENLFNPSDATTGSRLLNKNDETTTDENYGYSDYIDIAGIGYTLEGASTANLCVLYNSSKVGLISGTISKYAEISVRPEGTKYIRFNFAVSALDSLEFKKVTYETVNYITPEQISGGETNIRVGSGETYTSIKAAVDYANSVANENNIVNILIAPGTYDIIGDFDLSEQSASWVGLTLDDYVNLIGIGSPEDIILEGELPSDISSYAFTRNNVSTINAWKNNKLKNLTITAKNMRYCWHNEDGKIYAVEDAVEVVENCIFVYYENDSGVGSTSSVPIGTGASLGRKTTFKDCTFDNQSTTGGYAVLIHNNTTTTKYCEWNFESCDFIGGANNSLKLSSAGSGQTELVNIKGCRLPKSIRFDRQNVYTGTTCEYKVYGYGNSISGTVSWDGVTESADVLDMLLS